MDYGMGYDDAYIPLTVFEHFDWNADQNCDPHYIFDGKSIELYYVDIIYVVG